MKMEMMTINNIFNVKKPTHSQRKKKKERYIQQQERKLKAEKVRELFGKRDPNVRKQLVNLMKDRPEYKQELSMMKNLFIDLNRKKKS